MHSSRSGYGSAPVPHPDTCGVTIDNDHRCSTFSLSTGNLDEIGIYGEQHDVGGYPATTPPKRRTAAGKV